MIQWNDSNLYPVDKQYKILLEKLIEIILMPHDCGCMEICRCEKEKWKLEAIEEEAIEIQDKLKVIA